MQLVAMGAQDVYLTGNPQITFFKVVYRRHTNFSKEAIKQEWNGSGNSKTCTLARNGDLVQEIYMVNATGETQDVDNVNSVEVEIGGQKIDKHYSAWLAIYDELFEDNIGLKNAIHGSYMPLRFWFNRNPGLALPLIALQYHEVKIVADFKDGTKCGSLLVNYLYLDTDERRRFAQVSHEYLIEQVQFTGKESVCTASADTSTVSTASKSITLTFNHPVKALFWKGFVTGHGDGDDNADNQKGLASYTAKLQLNGHDRAAEQGNIYYTGVQPYENGLRHYYDSNNPLTTTHAGMYSFCLKPAEHQPSGTCNFSRIDNARLVLNLTGPSKSTDKLQLTAQDINIFALNYNVLRIMSGMGGLAYSN
jgi:hypothetical protein